jgi:hypothetical protein
MNCSAGFDTKDFLAFHDIREADEVFDLVNSLRNNPYEPPADS